MVLQHDNNNLVRKLDMTVHENQLSKHTIQMQEHDLMGLSKALEEKEKVCAVTSDKIEKYTADSLEYAHERDNLSNAL
jgi:site-specific recombinase XerD